MHSPPAAIHTGVNLVFNEVVEVGGVQAGSTAPQLIPQPPPPPLSPTAIPHSLFTAHVHRYTERSTSSHPTDLLLLHAFSVLSFAPPKNEHERLFQVSPFSFPSASHLPCTAFAVDGLRFSWLLQLQLHQHCPPMHCLKKASAPTSQSSLETSA